MYVRKFEGETLDETLQQVKRSLGPDAIILKTITNKGLKGAFKKGRIEITAAISEENYTKKARVDHILSDDQRERFYNAPSSEINHMVNEYNEHSSFGSKSMDVNHFSHNAENTHKGQAKNTGYGNLGLNKVVSTVSKATSNIKNSLDDFLTGPEENSEIIEEKTSKEITPREKSSNSSSSHYGKDNSDTYRENSLKQYEVLLSELDEQRNHIQNLESRFSELMRNVTLSKENNVAKSGNNDLEDEEGQRQLKLNLQSLDLDQKIISQILKKARFELDSSELKDEDTVFEFALRELSQMVKTEMPFFSKKEKGDTASITCLISENSSGQSSMCFKLAAIMDNVVVIRYRKNSFESISHSFACSLFNLSIIEVDSVSNLLSEIRKNIHDGKEILLDIKFNTTEEDDSKKVLDALKRSWSDAEFLYVLSAIHSEMYNRKIISRYLSFLDGVIITNVDQCLNYGAIFNLHYKYNDLPLKFFGTGPTIPDDLEAATSERLLAGMFNL